VNLFPLTLILSPLGRGNERSEVVRGHFNKKGNDVMNDIYNIFGWWIAVIEIPALSALFWMVQRLSRDLADYKLDAARNYARIADMQVLENRLTAHLLRIEAKLDVTSLKAEALQAEKQKH
jgi:hypothetical protein